MSVMVYHLQARARFHLGRRGVGIEATSADAPSDTVFSALCYALRERFGVKTLDQFLLDPAWASAPPLRISSAFPYVPARREDQVDAWTTPAVFDPALAVRLFPRPLSNPPGIPNDPSERKKVKRIAWLGETIFRDWVLGHPLAAHLSAGSIVQGNVWLAQGEAEQVAGWRDEETDEIRLWAVGDAPRVTVDRQNSASSVYQAGRVAFQDGGGLWLLADWRDDWRARGEDALRSLGDSGLGGERSAGHGQFSLLGPHAFSLPQPVAGGRFVTLALYHPAAGEISESMLVDASYRLTWRRGWMSSPDSTVDADGRPVHGGALRRRAVRMFDQGSILRWPAGATVLGDLANVTPDAFAGVHRVVRYGLSWPVGYTPAGDKT